MSDWGRESEDLFRAARRGLSPSASDRERVRAKIAVAVVGVAAAGGAAKAAAASAGGGASAGVGASPGVGASAGVGGAAAGGTAAAKGITLAKIAIPFVLAGAGIAAAPHVLRARVERAPSVAVVTAGSPAPLPGAHVATAAGVAAPSENLVAGHAEAAATSSDKLAVAASPPLGGAARSEPRAGETVRSPLSVDALPRASGPARGSASPPRGPGPTSTSGTVTAPPSIPAAPVVAAPVAAGPTSTGAAAAELEESALVGSIDAALRHGDAEGALQLAADHQRRFPQGALSEEREGARVVARCMSARSPGASDAAATFLSQHPRSPMRARIVATCGGASEPSTRR